MIPLRLGSAVFVPCPRLFFCPSQKEAYRLVTVGEWSLFNPDFLDEIIVHYAVVKKSRMYVVAEVVACNRIPTAKSGFSRVNDGFAKKIIYMRLPWHYAV
jgi:hypothetical protein